MVSHIENKDDSNNNCDSSFANSDDTENIDNCELIKNGGKARNKKINDDDDDSIIAQQETKEVIRLKFVVLIFLIFSAVGVACIVYFYTKNQEISQFEEQFINDSYKVLEAIGSGIENTFGALDIMATMMISYARSENQTWPFVTLPNFANHASKIRSMSVGMLLWSAIVVEHGYRLGWEQYALIIKNGLIKQLILWELMQIIMDHLFGMHQLVDLFMEIMVLFHIMKRK